MNTLIGTRFGTLEYAPQDVVTLIDGMIGFSNLTHFVLVPHKPSSPFIWLQSTQEAGVAFLAVFPECYFENYSPEIADSDAELIGLNQNSNALVLTTASIPSGRVQDMTLNLAAPIIVNPVSQVGRQVVLDNEAYTIKHRVFSQADQSALQAAA